MTWSSLEDLCRRFSWTRQHCPRARSRMQVRSIWISDYGGKLRNIEPDFAAVIAPGLHLAFQDRERIPLKGLTILGERAERDVWVCGPGAFLVLKALAFDLRGENKDAYDLYYVVRNYGAGVRDIARRLRPLLADPSAKEAIEIIRRDFLDLDGVGPRRVAEFVSGGHDEELQADVVGFIENLLLTSGVDAVRP